MGKLMRGIANKHRGSKTEADPRETQFLSELEQTPQDINKTYAHLKELDRSVEKSPKRGVSINQADLERNKRSALMVEEYSPFARDGSNRNRAGVSGSLYTMTVMQNNTP